MVMAGAAGKRPHNAGVLLLSPLTTSEAGLRIHVTSLILRYQTRDMDILSYPQISDILQF